MGGTESLRSGARRTARADWVLVVALDCERPVAPPVRLSLSRTDEVAIGRGTERGFARTLAGLRIDLPDRWTSQTHARLARTADGWLVEDAGSKNGTHVNGKRVDTSPLGDGDVLECGGTFLVLRRAPEATVDFEASADRPESLRTLSPTLERELGVLPKIARSRVPVLVLGDTGTGKEGVAAAIHGLSGRSGPFVAVNCGAIPATLVENELFGSRRGAFSGADNRVGLVRGADRGTLFLDEVAELPLPSQAALLRMLQEGEVQPLGGDKAIAVDVRVVAATNRDARRLVADGHLRRDLYARLRGYEVRLPPLRARIEDLGLLIAAVSARLTRGGAPRTLSRAAARALFAHPFPFNIRELEQIIGAALAVAGDEIDIDHLAPSLRDPADPSGSDRDRLATLVAQHGGNVSAVARELGTSRTQVRRLLRRHAISSDEIKRR